MADHITTVFGNTIAPLRQGERALTGSHIVKNPRDPNVQREKGRTYAYITIAVGLFAMAAVDTLEVGSIIFGVMIIIAVIFWRD